MSLYDIYAYVNTPAVRDGLSIGGILFIIITGLLQVSKIPINPWSWFLKKLGNALNIDIRNDVKAVSEKLDNHIRESEKERINNTRRDILDFCNSCMNKRKHTQEQYKFVIKQCDEYEKYIEDNNLKNGEVTSAIEEIRRLYTKCLQENSFLKEWQGDSGGE